MPCSDNGRIPDSELVAIHPYGRLREPAARGWEAPGGPADAGLEPTGPELSTYRDLSGQERTWVTYQAGGPLAAVPGTSEHGCGRAVDLKAMWMRIWIDQHGRAFGWAKIEAFSEWWHVNFVGGVKLPPVFKILRRGSRGKRVKRYSRRLAYILRSKGDRRREHADRKHYLRKRRRKYDVGMKRAVALFQRDHGLVDDGVIGPKTAAAIDATFHSQWEARSK